MDQETRARLDALRGDIENLWTYLGYDKEARDSLRLADKLAEEAEQYKELIRDRASDAINNSEKYNKSISSVGFVGYFAIWTLTKDNLTTIQSSIVALSGMASLVLFICWELYSMYIRSNSILEYVGLLNKNYLIDEFFIRFKELENKEKTLILNLQKIRHPILFATVAPAVIGGGVLIYAFSVDILAGLKFQQ